MGKTPEEKYKAWTEKSTFAQLKWAKRNERKTKRAIRRYDAKLTKAGKILGELHQAVASKDPKAIKKHLKWRVFGSPIKKLEQLKIKLGGYAAIISKLLAEALTLTGIKTKDRNELAAAKNSLLKLFDGLEEDIKEIAFGTQQLKDSTDAGDKLWNGVSLAIKRASKKITQIHDIALAGLALEHKVRENIKRA